MRNVIITRNYQSEPIDGNFLRMSFEVTLKPTCEGHFIFVVSLSADKESEGNVGGVSLFRVRSNFDQYNGIAAVSNWSIFSYWLQCTILLHSAARQKSSDFKPEIVECHGFPGLELPWICGHKYPIAIRMIGSRSEMTRKGSAAATEMVRRFSTIAV